MEPNANTNHSEKMTKESINHHSSHNDRLLLSSNTDNYNTTQDLSIVEEDFTTNFTDSTNSTSKPTSTIDNLDIVFMVVLFVLIVLLVFVVCK